MKRALTLTNLLTLGLLLATAATAQDNPEATPSPTPESGGEITVGVLGRDDIDSSKFEEYREVPKGVSVPFFNLYSTSSKVDFNLYGYNVRQDDQRYNGWFNTSAFDLSFDYNQTPHNMGNNGRTIFSETAPGVWSMSQTARQVLQAANDTRLPTSTRTVAFYDALLAPTFAAANTIDISSLRKRGTTRLDFGKKLPLDLTLTYMRELKSGYRTESGGNVRAQVNPAYEVPEPLDDLTQDFGVRAAYEFDKGNIHGSLNRNLYDNRAEVLLIDNPFQAFDAPYTSTSGGPANGRFINAPDNEATTTNLGFLLKFAKQTRISGDWSMGKWTQNADFYPYTNNTVVLTPTGARADQLSTLQQPSFDGKIDTTTLNLVFSSRPAKGLGLRAAFRSYELENKTNRYVVTGDTSISDRVWTVVTPTADSPYGHATANPYDTKTQRFTASASYDIGDLTLEGQYRNASFDRSYREAETGDENGFAFTALYQANDKVSFRGTYDETERTAEGHTVYGFQADEADRDTKRTGLDIELSPVDSFSVTFSYFRRDVEFPNRPDRVPVTSGVPTAGGQPFPGTPSGLLEAKYDSFTGEVAFNPNERFELGAYYTYEKDVTVNQWSTTTGLNLNNLLNYKGTDETDTFGFNGNFELKPDVCRLVLNLQRQKVDGLMDITAREAGSFYTPGRVPVVPAGSGGAQDITAWDDTTLTTFSAQLDYDLAENWTMTAGYLYEKYEFADAYTQGDLLMPQAVYIFMKADNGPYEANVVYAKLNYRF